MRAIRVADFVTRLFSLGGVLVAFLGLSFAEDYQYLGPRFEIEVKQDGLYRITYEALLAAGLPRASLRVSQLSMQSQGRDVAIHVEGGEDGELTSGDSILFYGRKFRGEMLADLYGDFMNGTKGPGWLQVCRNCRLAGLFEEYTDDNVYWLLVGSKVGTQMDSKNVRPAGGVEVQTYQATVRREESHIWWPFELESEDEWFWERINDPVWVRAGAAIKKAMIERKYPFRVTALSGTEGPAVLRVGLVSRNQASGSPDHHTQLAINEGERPIADETWDGGVRRTIEVTFPQSRLKEGNNILYLRELPQAGEELVALGVPWIYFDWFEVVYSRLLHAEKGQLLFRAPEPGRREYRISGFTRSDISIYDVSDPFRPRRLVAPRVNAEKSYSVTFSYEGARNSQIFVLDQSAILSPESVSFCQPPDFRREAEGEYVIITHPAFREQVQLLADYRRSRGLRVLVLEIQDLYREFNHGIYHPVAIRNFLAFAFEHWSKPPQYVVLVGSGHWNLKAYPEFPSPPVYMPPNLAYVDPWQGEVDSTNLLATLLGGDPIPDVHIARIPAQTTQELNAYIQKVIAYESLPSGDAPASAVFVADNTPDRAGNFKEAAEGVIGTYFGKEQPIQAVSIFLNDYGCRQANTAECQRVKDAIIEALNKKDCLFLNFLGHATIGAWTHEKVLDVDTLPQLTARQRLPILLSMTCLDGYWYHPGEESLVREMLFSPGGIVAAFAPTGMGLSHGHDVLHRGFFDAVLRKGIWQLGPAIMEARKRLYESGSNLDLLYTYTLLGDPALQIRRPRDPAPAR